MKSDFPDPTAKLTNLITNSKYLFLLKCRLAEGFTMRHNVLPLHAGRNKTSTLTSLAKVTKQRPSG